MKKNNKEVREKAMFSQRFIAIIIDVIIIGAVISVITMPLNMMNNQKNTERLNNELLEIVDTYTSGDINLKTYFVKAMDINHDIAKQNGLTTIISLVLNIVYFMIIPLYNKGQTFGKKLLKIRVENKDENKELTMNNLIIRALIINSILVNMITLAFALLGGREVYFFGALIFESIQMLILFISIIMISIRNDGKGLHDIAANTVVLRDEVMIKEEAPCES